MADTVANIAKGRIVEFYNRVKSNDPTNSAFIVVPILKGSMTDDQFRDADTLSAVLALCTERAASGWSRKTLTDADLAALPAPDDTNNRYDVDLPDQSWTPTNATHTVDAFLLCYDSDTTGGTDANILPLAKYDAPATITPDGLPIELRWDPAGFFRAS